MSKYEYMHVCCCDFVCVDILLLMSCLEDDNEQVLLAVKLCFFLHFEAA